MFDDGLGGTISVPTSPTYRVRICVTDKQNDQVSLHLGPSEILFSVDQAREIARHLLAATEIAQPSASMTPQDLQAMHANELDKMMHELLDYEYSGNSEIPPNGSWARTFMHYLGFGVVVYEGQAYSPRGDIDVYWTEKNGENISDFTDYGDAVQIAKACAKTAAQDFEENLHGYEFYKS